MELGYDYTEIEKLVQSKSDLLFQVVYLNLDICFYHDLSAIILACEENTE